jgi:hypothetical protein
MHIKTQIPAFQCVNSGHLERWRRFESTIFCSEQGGTNNLTVLQGLRLCYMKAGWPNEIVKMAQNVAQTIILVKMNA